MNTNEKWEQTKKEVDEFLKNYKPKIKEIVQPNKTENKEKTDSDGEEIVNFEAVEETKE